MVLQNRSSPKIIYNASIHQRCDPRWSRKGFEETKQVASEPTSKSFPRDVGGRPFQCPTCPRVPLLLDHCWINIVSLACGTKLLGQYNRTLATCGVTGCNVRSPKFHWRARRHVLEREGRELLVMGGTHGPITHIGLNHKLKST